MSRLATILGGGPSPSSVTTPGKCRESRSIVRRRLEELRNDLFAFALDDAVDGPARMLEDLPRRERGAVTAHEEEAAREPPLGLLGEIDDLGDVGQVVDAEADGVGCPVIQETEVVGMAEHLQVEDPDIVPSRAGGGGHEFDPERLEPQEDLRVHEAAGVAAQDLHRLPSL